MMCDWLRLFVFSFLFWRQKYLFVSYSFSFITRISSISLILRIRCHGLQLVFECWQPQWKWKIKDDIDLYPERRINGEFPKRFGTKRVDFVLISTALHFWRVARNTRTISDIDLGCTLSFITMNGRSVNLTKSNATKFTCDYSTNHTVHSTSYYTSRTKFAFVSIVVIGIVLLLLLFLLLLLLIVATTTTDGAWSHCHCHCRTKHFLNVKKSITFYKFIPIHIRYFRFRFVSFYFISRI